MTTLQMEIIVLWGALAAILGIFDLRQRRLPNKIILPALILVPLVNSFFIFGWKTTLFGGVAGLLIALIFLLFRAFRTQMGGGDFKLVVLLGFLVGYPWILVVVVGSVVLGATVSMFLLAAKKKKAAESIPFGPALCGMGIAVLTLIMAGGGV